MKSVEFCYWLQGMFELAKPVAFTPEQTEMIRAHLAMVFTHEIARAIRKTSRLH